MRSSADAFTPLLAALAVLLVLSGAAALFADANRPQQPGVCGTDGGTP